MTPPDALRARILAEVGKQPSATRRETTRQAWAVIGVGLALSVMIFIARGGVRPTHRAVELMIGTVAGATCIAALGLYGAFGRGRSMLGRSRGVLLALVVGLPLALLATKVLWSARFPGGLDDWPTRAGFKCLGVGLSTGLPVLLALFYIRRRSDPTHPILSGTALGVAVGAYAALLVDLWCPVAYVPHLMIGHLLPMALLGAAGAVLGWRVTALR